MSGPIYELPCLACASHHLLPSLIDPQYHPSLLNLALSPDRSDAPARPPLRRATGVDLLRPCHFLPSPQGHPRNLTPPSILPFILCRDEFVLDLARPPPSSRNLRRCDSPENNQWHHAMGGSIWSLPVPAMRPGELPSSLRRARRLSAAVGADTAMFLGRRRPGDDVAHGEPFISHPTTAYPFVLLVSLTSGPHWQVQSRPRAPVWCASPTGKRIPGSTSSTSPYLFYPVLAEIPEIHSNLENSYL